MDGVEDEVQEDVAKVKVSRTIQMPSAAVIEEHNKTHLLY